MVLLPMGGVSGTLVILVFGLVSVCSGLGFGVLVFLGFCCLMVVVY